MLLALPLLVETITYIALRILYRSSLIQLSNICSLYLYTFMAGCTDSDFNANMRVTK